MIIDDFLCYFLEFMPVYFVIHATPMKDAVFQFFHLASRAYVTKTTLSKSNKTQGHFIFYIFNKLPYI